MNLNDIVTINGKGKYEIICQAENSRVRFEVKDIDRGPGWSEAKQTYVGVKVRNGWYRGENYCFGEMYIIHKKNLNLKTI